MTSNYDPRKAVWNETEINNWEPANWRQWKSKHTGSPADFTAHIEREYLKTKYTVQQINERLDIDKVRIKLKLTNANSVGLQGTFPCQQGDVGINGSPNKQYTISLGLPANGTGLEKAEHVARNLSYQITHNLFQWTPELLGKKAQKKALPEEEKPAKLIREIIEEYEKDYWKTHDKNRQGLRNWKQKYINNLKKLPQNIPLSEEALVQALESTNPNTEARFSLVWQLKKFCSFCDFDGTKIIASYNTGAPKRKKRPVPCSDEEIFLGFKKIGIALAARVRKDAIQPEEWEWIYGMLATYGLRTHELFAVDLNAFIQPSNIHNLVYLKPELTGGTKTNERNCGIPPLHPEWVELFDLKNTRLPVLGGNFTSRTAIIAMKFRKEEIGFTPYDLRHAYAIRGHRLRIPIRTMSDYMGHTVSEHTETYQRWMTEDVNLEIYKEVVIEKQTFTKEEMRLRITELETENAALKTKNAALETEVESLRALLTEYRLNKVLDR